MGRFERPGWGCGRRRWVLLRRRERGVGLGGARVGWVPPAPMECGPCILHISHEYSGQGIHLSGTLLFEINTTFAVMLASPGCTT